MHNAAALRTAKQQTEKAASVLEAALQVYADEC
jgi:hypothetical protein